MKFPKIDISSLPDLNTLTGVFGTTTGEPGHNDTIVVLATMLYEMDTVGSGFM